MPRRLRIPEAVIAAALEAEGGHLGHTARRLGCAVSTVWKWVHECPELRALSQRLRPARVGGPTGTRRARPARPITNRCRDCAAPTTFLLEVPPRGGLPLLCDACLSARVEAVRATRPARPATPLDDPDPD